MPNFAINGFGRIGRNVLRAMTQKQVDQVLAINDLTDTHTLAHLLKWDSVHGKFEGEIGYDDENIIVRGHKIKVLKERDPANLPWKKLETGARCGHQYHSVHNRRGEGDRRSDSRIERQIKRRRLPRAHSRRVGHRFFRGARQGYDS